MESGPTRRLRPGSIAGSGIRHVGLKVADLSRSVRFYRNILGLDGRTIKRGVVHVPSGSDMLVSHGKGYGTSNIHFGFRVASPSKVEKWRVWLRSRSIKIYQEVTEERYRSLKIRDPDGYLIEIFYDGREIVPTRSKPLSKPRH